MSAIPRTSNAAEAFHKVLSNVVSSTRGLRSVRMSDVIEAVQREEQHTRLDAALLLVNPSAQIRAHRKGCMIERDARLREVIRNQPRAPARPLNGINYLKAVAACLARYQ